MNPKQPILVVDDDHHLLELIVQMLELHDLTCETACDGIDAMKRIRSNFYPLIISDLRMPNMNGTTLLHEIRKHQGNVNKCSKVILMTAYSSDKIIDQITKLGVDGFINKPFDVTDFMTTIQKVLGTA